MADEKIVPENGLEVRYERYKGIIKNFTLMSDIFMRNVFKQRECLEYVLQVIMEKQDLKVIEQIIQKDYKNLQGRSSTCEQAHMDSDLFSLVSVYNYRQSRIYILINCLRLLFRQHYTAFCTHPAV